MMNNVTVVFCGLPTHVTVHDLEIGVYVKSQIKKKPKQVGFPQKNEKPEPNFVV